MPRGDRTGPFGEGPRSGRGLGYCNGYNSPGFTKGGGLGLGRGHGRGRGFGRKRGYGYGRGYRNFAPYPPNNNPYPYQQNQAAPANEKEYLEDQYKLLEQEMEEVKKRLDALKNEEE